MEMFRPNPLLYTSKIPNSAFPEVPMRNDMVYALKHQAKMKMPRPKLTPSSPDTQLYAEPKMESTISPERVERTERSVSLSWRKS